MTRQVLNGLNGANPLGFLASIGLLRVLDRSMPGTRMGFTENGAFSAWVDCDSSADIGRLVAEDAAGQAGPQPWRLRYFKAGKNGPEINDLKPPPGVFRDFMEQAITLWVDGEPGQAEYAAGYGTDVAVDNKGNTKPTALHFTAARQEFLATVEKSRASVTEEWASRALRQLGALKAGNNLRWDPDAERIRALMGENPGDGETFVNSPLEWLAFRALPCFPCVPIGSRAVTTCVSGRRQHELHLNWPLWAIGADLPTVRSLLVCVADWGDAMGATSSLKERRARGVIAMCRSEIRRTAMGFGNFGPAFVRS